MSSTARQTKLGEYSRESLAVTNGQVALIEPTDRDQQIALILQKKLPHVKSGDRLELYREEDDWEKTVNVVETAVLPVSEIADYLEDRGAKWWTNSEPAILDFLTNLYGDDVSAASEFFILTIEQLSDLELVLLEIFEG